MPSKPEHDVTRADPIAADAGSFYTRRAPCIYESNRATTGPWDPRLQHGGPPAALLGHTLQQRGGPPGSRLARITFDFYGPVPVSEVSVESEVLRSGSRIQLSAATLRAGARIVMRSTAWHLLAEAGRSPGGAPAFIIPALPTQETIAQFPGAERFPYGDAVEWRFAEGAFDQLGPGTVWTRCRIPLVQGKTLTGLERTLIAVDAANGISAELPFADWTFVPVDLTVVMVRHAESEWVGMSAKTTLNPDGIGITETVLFDEQGAFGRALQTLFITPR